MVYTSYFAKSKDLLSKRILPISICAKPPKGYTGLQYKKLAPTYNILMTFKEDGDTEKYIKDYTEQILNNLDADNVIMELESMLEESGLFIGYDICLLCYEKSESFCHRHLVSEWLRNNGYDSIEL